MNYTRHVCIWCRSMDVALKSGLWNFYSSIQLFHYKEQMKSNEKRQGSVCVRMRAPKAWDILQVSITKVLMLIWQTSTNVIPESICNASGYFRVVLLSSP